MSPRTTAGTATPPMATASTMDDNAAYPQRVRNTRLLDDCETPSSRITPAPVACAANSTTIVVPIARTLCARALFQNGGQERRG